VDLFSGCGGLTEGLRRGGFRVLAAVELDELAAETYAVNHPEVRLIRGDIRKVRPDKLMRRLGLRQGQLTLLAGCPPCQGFSSVRTRRKSAVVDDPRNDLVAQMLRFTRTFLPKAVMMENVPALAEDVRMTRLRSGLEKLGYRCNQLVLDAADHGVPQRRRRLVLLAGRRRTLSPPLAITVRLTVRAAIEGLATAGSSGDPLHDLPETRTPAVRALIAAVPKDGGSRAQVPGGDGLACHREFDGFKDVYGRMPWDDVAPTITGGCVNPSKGRFVHPQENRSVTLREAALLQGFPPDYRFSLRRGKLLAAAMIGNALPPPLAEAQARALIADLNSRNKAGAR